MASSSDELEAKSLETSSEMMEIRRRNAELADEVRCVVFDFSLMASTTKCGYVLYRFHLQGRF